MAVSKKKAGHARKSSKKSREWRLFEDTLREVSESFADVRKESLKSAKAAIHSLKIVATPIRVNECN